MEARAGKGPGRPPDRRIRNGTRDGDPIAVRKTMDPRLCGEAIARISVRCPAAAGSKKRG